MEENLQKSLKPDAEVMEQLLRYFESESAVLDELHNTDLIPGLSYVSYIVFDGVPILPPMMTPLRREEMLMYKRQAVLTETRLRARARHKLLQRVQHVMAEIEESQERVSSRQSKLNKTTDNLLVHHSPTNISVRPFSSQEDISIRTDSNFKNTDNDSTEHSNVFFHRDDVNSNTNELLKSGEKDIPKKGALDGPLQGITPISVLNQNESLQELSVKIKTSPKSALNNSCSVQDGKVSDEDRIIVQTASDVKISATKTDLHGNNENFNQNEDNLVTVSRTQSDNSEQFILDEDLANVARSPKSSQMKIELPEKEGSSDYVNNNNQDDLIITDIKIDSQSDKSKNVLTRITNEASGNKGIGNSASDETSEATKTERSAPIDGGNNTGAQDLNSYAADTDSGVFSQQVTIHGTSRNGVTDISSSQTTPHDLGNEPTTDAEINVEPLRHTEGEKTTQSEMSIGLQLLRSKLQQQQGSKDTEADKSNLESLKTWPLTKEGASSIPQNAMSMDSHQGTVNKKRSSAAAWIQQSLAQISPPPETTEQQHMNGKSVGTSTSNSVRSSATSGNTYSSEELNNTVIVNEQASGSVYSDSSGQMAEDEQSIHDHSSGQLAEDEHSIHDHSLEAIQPKQPSPHRPGYPQSTKPDLPLLSKVTFDVTPDVSPRKLPSNTENGNQAQAFEFENVPSKNMHHSQARKDSHPGSIPMDTVEDKASVESPGPTKTPNLSNISFHDSESDEHLPVVDPFVVSATTDAVITESTELAQYMYAGVTNSMDDVQTLPHSDDPHTPKSGDTEVKRTPSTGHSTRQRVRKNSYTLDQPSPALLAAQMQGNHKEIVLIDQRQPELTGSMEDLKIKHVQRKLSYDKPRNNIGAESAPAAEDPELMVIPVVDVDEEKHGKREHLQRYLQNLSEMPGMSVTSDNEDVLSDDDLPSTIQQTGAQTLPMSATNQPIMPWITSQSQPMGQSMPHPMGGQLSSMTEPMGNVLTNEPQSDVSEESMLQSQVMYFEQLQRSMVQQQQQQLAILIAEQEKQQRLFREQILQQGQRLNQQQQRSRKEKGQPGADLSQCQAWLEQLQGLPNIAPNHPQTSLPLEMRSLPLGAQNVPSEFVQSLHGRCVQNTPGSQNVEYSYTGYSPSISNGILGPSAASTLPILTQLQNLQNNKTGTGIPMASQLSGLPGYQGLLPNDQSRPDSGLSDTSTLTVTQLSNLTGGRADSAMSMLASILRPQSAPTPRQGYYMDPADGSSSPAGPAGVYYNQAFITDASLVENSAAESSAIYINDNNDSPTYHSPAVLRSKSKRSPQSLPLETVAINRDYNSMDTSLHSSERSVHFASPVHHTQYIEGKLSRNAEGDGSYEDVSSPHSNTGYHLSIYDKDIPAELEPCFVKLSAVVKGYLTRRLLRTEKVQGLIKTIRDTAEFAINFQQESPIKRGVYSNQDRKLQEQVIAQLTGVMYEIHETFFDLTTQEKMAIIRIDRQVEREKLFKSQSYQEKKKRLSTATLRAMDRKKKQLAAEEVLFGEARPKSAPPPTTKSKTPRGQKIEDVSGPLRRHYQFLFNRALKPQHGNTSPRKPGDKTGRDSARSVAPRKTNIQSKPQTTVRPVKTRSPAVTSTAVRKTSQQTKPTVRKIARPSTAANIASKPENKRTPGAATYSNMAPGNVKSTNAHSRLVKTTGSS